MGQYQSRTTLRSACVGVLGAAAVLAPFGAEALDFHFYFNPSGPGVQGVLPASWILGQHRFWHPLGQPERHPPASTAARVPTPGAGLD